MRWASALTENASLEAAVAEAAAVMRATLGDAHVDLALVFMSPHYAARAAELPALLEAHLPGAVLLGCTAGGVIGAGHEVEQRPALSLTAAALPGVSVQPFVLDASGLPDADAPPRAWQAALGVEPQPQPHFVLLADPFSFPAERLLGGLDYAFPASTKIGGLASGADRPGGNALFSRRQVLRGGAAGVALAGDIAVDTIVAQGCRPIGRVLRITRCDGQILLELENEPALQVLQEIAESASERDRQLLSHALFLGIAMDELAQEHRAGDFLIRNLIGIEPRHGALAVGERLRNGQSVQFHVRDARTSAEDLEQLLERFAEGPHAGAAHGALLFSCLGRGVHLYGQADHDTGVFRRVVGELPLGGFFCNGEIGPVGGSTYLHGFTSSFGIFRRPGRTPGA